MTTSPSRDIEEAESLEPAQSLDDLRKARARRDYRDYCEEVQGLVAVAGEEFHPADILDALAPSVAKRILGEAATKAREDILHTVCEQFPAPIAVSFQGFLYGSRESLRRLNRLKDTWESLVRLLAALALSEAAEVSESLKPLRVRDGKDQRWRECKRQDLYSDRLAVCIGIIEGVLHCAEQNGVALEVASLLPTEVLNEIRRLNVVRNGFSHDSVKSERQVKAILDETEQLLLDVLLDLRGLQDVELYRIDRIHPGGSAEVERRNGHAQSRTIIELVLDAKASSLAHSALPIGGMSRVMARIGELTLDLSPFVYAVDDDTGHLTRVLHFKSKKNDQWLMESVADSISRTSAVSLHKANLDRIEKLLAKGQV